MSDERFFIGWKDGSKSQARPALRRSVIGVLVISIATAVLCGLLQRTPGRGTFALGNVQRFEGVFLSQPSPMLIPTSESVKGQVLLLVNPLKFGFPQEVSDRYHLKSVSLQGTLVQDELNSMIEVVPDSVTVLGNGEGGVFSEGRSVMLKGEIVDSKCHIGVMNPGRYKTHRACAIQCIAGGIPPLMVIESVTGERQQYLVVGEGGEALNEEVLDFVAEPVRLGGITKRIGSLRVLFADLKTLSRL